MIGNSKHSIRLMSWRTLRWAIALPTLPLVWWACTSHPLTQPVPEPEQQTDIYISVSPTRLLDLIFMVDNSPSMAPKQAKLKAQFPLLLNALQDPNDPNGLPDLHVAIIDSDLGTGGAWSSGSCGPNAENGNSNYGDQGKFRMINSVSGSTPCGVTSPDALWLEYTKGKPVNFTGQIGDVFGCLAMNLGTLGCGEEHQLQAFEFALVAAGLNNEAQHAILRPNAYLGLVFLTDEDDCSAAQNDGMFGDKAELRNESASLRCYSRSHMCGNQKLTDGAPGYPTTAAFSAPLSTCQARTDSCPNVTDGDAAGTDTNPATTCSPLKNIKHLADEIKGLKTDPDNQILVAGIFGWPLNGVDPATAQYKIDMIPNPNTADSTHLTVWDSWPVCYDPSHKPANPGTFDTTAAGWGATAGLRNAAFIDEFGANGLKFSICEADFTNAMKTIGDKIAQKLQNLCVDYKLMDKDKDPSNGLQPDCRVVYRTPKPDPTNPLKVVYDESSTSLPMCDAGATVDNITADCWTLVLDKTKCPDAYNGQLINVLRPRADSQNDPKPAGTKVSMQCRTCTDFKDLNGNPLPGC
jgi:hypothetical protein